MLVADLKQLLKKYEKEELRQVIIEMYKAMPKKLKEDKDIDLMLDDIIAYPNIMKFKKIQAAKVDINKMKEEIDEFVKFAYEGYYYTSNNYVPKKERPKWRFKVKAYVKNLQTVPYEGEEGKTATKLLLDIYNMLCYGTVYYLFSSIDPFNSAGINKEELLDTIIKRKLYMGVTSESVKSAIEATVGNQSTWFCIETLLNNLKSADAKMFAIEQSKIVKTEVSKLIVRSKKYSYDTKEYILKEKINALVTLITILHLELCEYTEAISYFNSNYNEDKKEKSLNKLLSLIEKYNLPDIWMSEYKRAKSDKIKITADLNAKYKYIKENKAFPVNDEI